jgi:hypothetical protein
VKYTDLQQAAQVVGQGVLPRKVAIALVHAEHHVACVVGTLDEEGAGGVRSLGWDGHSRVFAMAPAALEQFGETLARIGDDSGRTWLASGTARRLVIMTNAGALFVNLDEDGSFTFDGMRACVPVGRSPSSQAECVAVAVRPIPSAFEKGLN